MCINFLGDAYHFRYGILLNFVENLALLYIHVPLQ